MMESEIIEEELYFKIELNSSMRPFFMSIVSDSNHWMFISSNGGLSAGRRDANQAIFPYYTDDKIAESYEITGSKSLFSVDDGNRVLLWEPFSMRQEGLYTIQRYVYKSISGNKIIFEEINHDLGLSFRYQWVSSDRFGFVKRSRLFNRSSKTLHISLLDGVQNLLPYGVNSDLQNQSSNLVDAYKRSELIDDVGLAIYALSAIIVDKAEPAESLKANVAWSYGLDHPIVLLSALQLNHFRQGHDVRRETDIKAEKGAYFVNSTIALLGESSHEWGMAMDVNQSQSSILALAEFIRRSGDLDRIIDEDVTSGTRKLLALCASADGLQYTADNLIDARHFSNTLFNIMRGGVFDDNYYVEGWDFINYLQNANVHLAHTYSKYIASWPDGHSYFQLCEWAEEQKDYHLLRLCVEYLPLKFSRRHGDPSRPWNRFTINTRSEIDGSKLLDYEGNWRDIFQNWEALVYSFPAFIEGMIFKFLNSTTFDGYNPYRVTKGGFDWETIEPDDPWSYIGYWGDHQIIYLLKFLEFIQNHFPGRLMEYLDQECFVYANVPYRIKNYEDILLDPKDTILFDIDLHTTILEQKAAIGADGALLRDRKGDVYQVSGIEKLLASVLAKISNFIPEGGIWMNTQRPEWNDANNALVGNGISMVTLCYLRRFLSFFAVIIEQSDKEKAKVSVEMADFFAEVQSAIFDLRVAIENPLGDTQRRQIVDMLGQAGSRFRSNIYVNAFSNEKKELKLSEILQFIHHSIECIDHSIALNRRPDRLFHAYNILNITGKMEMSVTHLNEMLEGQVAILSSGSLTPIEVLDVLDSLRSSRLYRPDQNSYILYPNKELKGFLERNIIPEAAIDRSELLKKMVLDADNSIIERDVFGGSHFNGAFKNAADLERALLSLRETKYARLSLQEKNLILQIFEDVFQHKLFTGRSGTFYGYEGLGSIYWHMVSKLRLAVLECYMNAANQGCDSTILNRIEDHYYNIADGIGVHKSPKLYGAFTTDPYSHTPFGRGAQQPGMTGQVKEDILCRMGELGVSVQGGMISFIPTLLKREEFHPHPTTFKYINIEGDQMEVSLPSNALCYTHCQIPIIYQIRDEERLEVVTKDEASIVFSSLSLDHDTSAGIFRRAGKVNRILVSIKEDCLK